MTWINPAVENVLAALSIMAGGMCLNAQEPLPPSRLQVKIDDLERFPIRIGELSLKINRLNYRLLVMEIRNQSDHFVGFSPSDLAIIGNDGSQSIVEAIEWNDPGKWGAPPDVKVGPMAYLRFKYILSNEVRFPAKLYVSGKVVAEITK